MKKSPNGKSPARDSAANFFQQLTAGLAESSVKIITKLKLILVLYAPIEGGNQNDIRYEAKMVFSIPPRICYQSSMAALSMAEKEELGTFEPNGELGVIYICHGKNCGKGLYSGGALLSCGQPCGECQLESVLSPGIRIFMAWLSRELDARVNYSVDDCGHLTLEIVGINYVNRQKLEELFPGVFP